MSTRNTPAVAAATQPVPAASSEPTSWKIDVDHTEVGFKVRHMMVSNTRGRFKKFEGTVRLDEQNPGNTEVDVRIDAASLDTGSAQRDDHLRSPDFFDAVKFPQLTFRSTHAEAARDGGLKITGDLTIRGVTRPVVLEVAELGAPAKDPWGGIRRGTSASTRINRKDFGLVWNAGLETGGVLVGDEVTISLDVELVRA